MKKNERIFSFGKINKYFIIPFLCPIFHFLSGYSLRLYSTIPNENEVNEKINS